MPSAAFMKALPFVLRWEGGYVNHPKDPGGATNKGVTQQVYSDWLKRHGRVNADVSDLTDADMAAIYEEGYWDRAHCEELSPRLGQVQFDTAVNMGVGRAVRFLQEAVGAVVDGGFGPGTRQSVQAADPEQALTRYLDIRERFYRNLVNDKPELATFLKGWLNRLGALRHVVSGLQAVGAANEVTQRIPDAQTETAVLRWQAGLLQKALAAQPTDAQRQQVAPLLVALRNKREWAGLRGLAEALLRIDPAPPEVWRLYGQALIEDGALVPAACVLDRLASSLPKEHPEYGEAWGLLGRVHKQRFAELTGATAELRRQALGDAIAAYEVPYRVDPGQHSWHGVNLLATVARARREGWDDVGAHWDIGALASALLKAVADQPAHEWRLPTLAEVSLAAALNSGDLGIVEQALRPYLTDEGTQAFHVASTLRQFTEIWQLEQITPDSPGHSLRSPAAVQQAHNLVDMLRARLLSLPDGQVSLPPRRRAEPPAPTDTQLQAVLGGDGPVTFQWWRAGVKAGESVAAVRQRLGKRFGTGFLVRAGDLGLKGAPPDELLLLTNFHVVNPDGAEDALKPADAEVVFEGRDSAAAYGVKEVVWHSPVDKHDASLLRLTALPPGALPLTLSRELPARAKPAEKKPRVYIIGHPDGGDLAVSMNDNELLDHEGLPGGQPGIKGVCRVHYRAPTKPGSSGSPVFQEQGWKVIALHHAGGQGVQKLNGLPGFYDANEGLAIGPLALAAASAKARK